MDGGKKKEVGKEAGCQANNASQSTLCRIQLATMAPNQVTCGVVHAGGVENQDQAAISFPGQRRLRQQTCQANGHQTVHLQNGSPRCT